MRTNKGDATSRQERAELQVQPDFLELPAEQMTESIDIDNLFSKDVTNSGSFDLRQPRNVSFAKLLGALPLPTFLLDASHRIVFFNDAMAKAGGESSAHVGAPFASLFPTAVDCERAVSILREVFLDRKTKVFEGVAIIGGLTRWCRTHLRSIRFSKERLVLAMMEDLTAEKRQLILAEKYQRLVEVFPIGIAEFVIDPTVAVDASMDEILAAVAAARLVGGNREFARMYGTDTIEDLRAKLLKELLPFSAQYELLYRMWIKGQFPLRSFETRHTWPDQSGGYLENTLVGNVKKGYLYGLWVMRQDITHRKESEEALRAARDRLEERVRERTAELLRANQQLLLEVVEREKAEQELEKLVGELQQALTEVKTLSGLLPICASCKKIRDDRGYWTQVEVYVREHSDAEFTHSICPDCARRLYPSLYNSSAPGGDR